MRPKRSTHYYIYALCDPRNGEIRYVGRTEVCPTRRHEHHTWASKTGRQKPVNVWIRELLSEGWSPVIVILDRTDDPRAEKAWIKKLADKYDLINMLHNGWHQNKGTSLSTRHNQKISDAITRLIGKNAIKLGRSADLITTFRHTA